MHRLLSPPDVAFWLPPLPLLLRWSGESYGGIYVPLFTQRLLQHNQQQAAKRTSAAPTAAAAAVTSEDEEPEVYNLVGYIVGNAVTDDEFDGNGQVDFAYGMGLIDPATYKSTRSICKVRTVAGRCRGRQPAQQASASLTG